MQMFLLLLLLLLYILMYFFEGGSLAVLGCPKGGGSFPFPPWGGWVRIFSGTTHLQKMQNVRKNVRHYGIVHTYKLRIPLSK